MSFKNLIECPLSSANSANSLNSCVLLSIYTSLLTSALKCSTSTKKVPSAFFSKARMSTLMSFSSSYFLSSMFSSSNCLTRLSRSMHFPRFFSYVTLTTFSFSDRSLSNSLSLLISLFFASNSRYTRSEWPRVLLRNSLCVCAISW